MQSECGSGVLAQPLCVCVLPEFGTLSLPVGQTFKLEYFLNMNYCSSGLQAFDCFISRSVQSRSCFSGLRCPWTGGLGIPMFRIRAVFEQTELVGLACKEPSASLQLANCSVRTYPFNSSNQGVVFLGWK